MKIGGLIKSSMIDYPGKISCVIFAQGCNFICPFCHNSTLIPMNYEEEYYINYHQILRFLEKRKGLIEGVVITGGEPTLQKDELVYFCQMIKEIGYPIKLDTNGSSPELLKILIGNGLVDYVAMDIKTVPGDYSPLISNINPQKLLHSIRIIMSSTIDYEFRTTCVKPFVNKEMIKEVCGIIQGAKHFTLQTFNSDNVYSPWFCNAVGPLYTDQEIKGFADIAKEYVQSCTIR